MGIGKGKALANHLGAKPSYNKQEAVKAHKIVVLCELLVNELDNYGSNLSEQNEGFSEACKKVISNCEDLLDRAYGINMINKSTYMQELTSKVDTVLRKNYQLISE